MCELWQKVTDDQDMIALLCDIAMEVDRGLVDTYPEFTLRLGKTNQRRGGCLRFLD